MQGDVTERIVALEETRHGKHLVVLSEGSACRLRRSAPHGDDPFEVWLDLAAIDAAVLVDVVDHCLVGSRVIALIEPVHELLNRGEVNPGDPELDGGARDADRGGGCAVRRRCTAEYYSRHQEAERSNNQPDPHQSQLGTPSRSHDPPLCWSHQNSLRFVKNNNIVRFLPLGALSPCFRP